MEYSYKKTGLKMLKVLVLFIIPVLVNQFVVQYPEIAQLTVGSLLYGLSNLLREKYAVKYIP